MESSQHACLSQQADTCPGEERELKHAAPAPDAKGIAPAALFQGPFQWLNVGELKWMLLVVMALDLVGEPTPCSVAGLKFWVQRSILTRQRFTTCLQSQAHLLLTNVKSLQTYTLHRYISKGSRKLCGTGVQLGLPRLQMLK